MKLTSEHIDALSLVDYEGATIPELEKLYGSEIVTDLLKGDYIMPSEQVKDLVNQEYWHEFSSKDDWFVALTSNALEVLCQ